MSDSSDWKQKAIEAAQARVEKLSPDGNRKWLFGAPPDSYGSESQRCQLLVREGSPPRGYVLVLPSVVFAFNSLGKRIGRWEHADE